MHQQPQHLKNFLTTIGLPPNYQVHSFCKMSSLHNMFSVKEAIMALEEVLKFIRENTNPGESTSEVLVDLFEKSLNNSRLKIISDGPIGNTLINFGKNKGKRFCEMFQDPNGKSWFSWLLNGGYPKLDPEIASKLKEYRDHVLKELGIDIAAVEPQKPAKKRKVDEQPKSALLVPDDCPCC